MLLPDECLELIFLCLSTENAIKCQLVCRKWRTILNSVSFWLLKAEKDGIYISLKNIQIFRNNANNYDALVSLQMLCLYRTVNTNLIVNPCGEDNFYGWEVKPAGVIIEEYPVGSYCIPEDVGVSSQHSFVHTYYWCTRHQRIDLKKSKVPLWIMDNLQLIIKVIEWESCRFDCGGNVIINVRFEKKHKVIQEVQLTWSDSDEGCERMNWSKVEKSIERNFCGVRYIVFESRGKDDQYWAGHYGPKSTASCIMICI